MAVEGRQFYEIIVARLVDLDDLKFSTEDAGEYEFGLCRASRLLEHIEEPVVFVVVHPDSVPVIAAVEHIDGKGLTLFFWLAIGTYLGFTTME